MNIMRIAFILALFAALAIPGTAGAYNNQFSVGLGYGTGDATAGGTDLDAKTSQASIEYKRFFTGIETTDSPYSVREFLQHPSWLSIGLDFRGMKVDSKATNQSIKFQQGEFGISGIYYLDSGTGIGGAIKAHPGSTNYDNVPFAVNEVHSGTELTLTLHQYITGEVRLGADLSSGAFKTEESDSGVLIDEYDETMIFAYVDALVNEFFYIRAGMGTGEQEYDGGGTTDLSRFSLTAGVFPNQRLGVFLTHEAETEDDPSEESTMTTTEVSAEYFFNDRMSLEGALGIFKIEDGLDLDATTLGLLFSIVY